MTLGRPPGRQEPLLPSFTRSARWTEPTRLLHTSPCVEATLAGLDVCLVSGLIVAFVADVRANRGKVGQGSVTAPTIRQGRR